MLLKLRSRLFVHACHACLSSISMPCNVPRFQVLSHTRKHSNTHAQLHVHACAHARTHTHIHTHTHEQTNTNIHTNTCACSHAHTHAHTHAHPCTSVHGECSTVFFTPAWHALSSNLLWFCDRHHECTCSALQNTFPLPADSVHGYARMPLGFQGDDSDGDDGPSTSGSGATVGMQTSHIKNKIVRSEMYAKLRSKDKVGHCRTGKKRVPGRAAPCARVRQWKHLGPAMCTVRSEG